MANLLFASRESDSLRSENPGMSQPSRGLVLRLQAEEAFADPAWRLALNHGLSVRAADNEPDPSRGLAGYITTYQAIAAAPELHLGPVGIHAFHPCLAVIHALHGRLCAD